MASEVVAPTIDPLAGVEPAPLSSHRAAAGDVARDMESIFGSAPAHAAPPPPRRSARRDAAPPEARGSRLAAVGGLAAAAFLGVAAGAFLMTDHAPTGPKPPLRALPVEIAQARAAPAPGPIEPLPLPQSLQAATPPGAAPVEAPPQVRPARVRASRHVTRGCCGYVQMAAADRRLRAAYAEAVRAGAPRPLLVSYRDRWAEVRRQGAHEPRRLVEGYGALAAGLDHAAAEARAHSRRYADRRGWRPRYAPWWS